MSFETVQSSGKIDRPHVVNNVHHVVYTFQLVVNVAEIGNFEHVDLVPVDGASTSSFHLRLLPLSSTVPVNAYDVFDF